MSSRISSVGELILQYVCHSTFKAENILNPPKAIISSHFNETQSRIVVEAATAYLYAEEPIKKMIVKNLEPFANRTGNNWIFDLIN
jgi:hypothetical protein